MNYPNRVIKLGETDTVIVTAICNALVSRGYKMPPNSVGFDAALKTVVKLFQAQNSDRSGFPLKVDGGVGPLTWGALFSASLSNESTSSIAHAALLKAIDEIGTMESPLGSNQGPRVDQYQITAGLGGGGFYWCMAFVYWCFEEAHQQSGKPNPFPRTAGCIDAWNKVKRNNPNKLITKAQAVANPSLVKPGAVFILDYGNTLGHTGFVRSNSGGALVTVEGNANSGGSRNGLGVFELNRRSVMMPNLRGFIDFT